MGSVFTCKQNPCCGDIHNCKPPVSFTERRRMTMSIVEEIAAERRRQTDVEGWSPEHDDQHADGAIALAAAAYALQSARYPLLRGHSPPPCWPWDLAWWKPKDPRRDLIRAAALIVAEIDRLDRRLARKDPTHD